MFRLFNPLLYILLTAIFWPIHSSTFVTFTVWVNYYWLKVRNTSVTEYLHISLTDVVKAASCMTSSSKCGMRAYKFRNVCSSSRQQYWQHVKNKNKVFFVEHWEFQLHTFLFLVVTPITGRSGRVRVHMSIWPAPTTYLRCISISRLKVEDIFTHA